MLCTILKLAVFGTTVSFACEYIHTSAYVNGVNVLSKISRVYMNRDACARFVQIETSMPSCARNHLANWVDEAIRKCNDWFSTAYSVPTIAPIAIIVPTIAPIAITDCEYLHSPDYPDVQYRLGEISRYSMNIDDCDRFVRIVDSIPNCARKNPVLIWIEEIIRKCDWNFGTAVPDCEWKEQQSVLATLRGNSPLWNPPGNCSEYMDAVNRIPNCTRNADARYSHKNRWIEIYKDLKKCDDTSGCPWEDEHMVRALLRQYSSSGDCGRYIHTVNRIPSCTRNAGAAMYHEYLWESIYLVLQGCSATSNGVDSVPTSAPDKESVPALATINDNASADVSSSGDTSGCTQNKYGFARIYLMSFVVIVLACLYDK